MKTILAALAVLTSGPAAAQLAVGPAARDFIPAILDAGPVPSAKGLASDLKVGETFAATACSCSRAVGADGAPQAVACNAPAGAQAFVRRYRNATGEQGLVLSFGGLDSLTGLDVPYSYGFQNIVLTRDQSRGSAPFENPGRQPFEVVPGTFGPSKPYSDTLSQTYTRAWDYGTSEISQTDDTDHRLEKLGIVYRKVVDTSRLRRDDSGRLTAELDLTVAGVDRLSPESLSVLRDSGLYHLAGLYEQDRQLTRRYQASCALDRR